ncbi:MAG TPA: PIN domain-containing protein [Chthoniobacterales bacterium]
MSVITEMELLAWPSLTVQEETNVREFLRQIVICELTPSIRARAVQLRREEHLKLPDAAVCATAMEFGVELWTNDVALAKVPGLICHSVSLSH